MTGENLMPFANTTFTLDLAKPFTNYLTHLMADPSTNQFGFPTSWISAEAFRLSSLGW